MTDERAVDRPQAGLCTTEHETSAAERRRFLESAAAVTVSAERVQHRAAVRVLHALGYRQEAAQPCMRRAPSALFGRVLGDEGLIRPLGRLR